MGKERKDETPEIIPSDIYIPLGLVVGGALLAGHGFGTNNGAEIFIGLAIFSAGVGGAATRASDIIKVRK